MTCVALDLKLYQHFVPSIIVETSNPSCFLFGWMIVMVEEWREEAWVDYSILWCLKSDLVFCPSCCLMPDSYGILNPSYPHFAVNVTKTSKWN